MSQPIRWGIMGAGWIADRFAADLSYTASGRVSRVAALKVENAERLAGIHEAQAAETAEDLVRAGDVDVIYIATPASLHHAHCLMALEAGKPVLCEKPFALNAGQAREIAAAARDAGVFCMEAMWTRFLPTIAETRALIRSGDLGRPTQIAASLGFPRAESNRSASITAPEFGGGALLDLGIYGVSIAQDFFGVPQRLTAQAVHSETGSLRDITISMQHEVGGRPVLSTIRASHTTALANTLEIGGTKGKITVSAPFIQAAAAVREPVCESPRASHRPSALSDAIRSSVVWPVARSVALRMTGRAGRRYGRMHKGYGLCFEADEVARCLAAGRTESDVMPLAASVEVLETIDRINALLDETG